MNGLLRKFTFLSLAWSLAFGRALAAESNNAPATVAELRQRIQELTSHPRYQAAMWGIKILNLDTHQLVFAQNAEKLFSPASNSKLYSMALALDRLGPDYRIRTSMFARAKPDANGVLASDLLVYGRGDPTLTLKRNGGDIHRALQPLVSALTNAGVRQIKGDLIGDESFLHGDPYGAGWEWEDLQSYYGAEISSLTINDNTLQVIIKPGAEVGQPCRISFAPATDFLVVSNRTHSLPKGAKRSLSLHRSLGENVLYVSGGLAVDDAQAFTDDVTVHGPARLFVELLRETLQRAGLTVTGRVRSVNWLDREVEPVDWSLWKELAGLDSPPLSELLMEVMKPSQNLYTDLLLEHVGMVQLKGTPLNAGETSEEAGIHALRAFLAEVKIPRGEVSFNEGSGLSRNNLTTPNATTALLTFMNHHKYREAYYNALPIAGVDGTLRRRMKGTVAEGKLRAKTGTLSGANSLAGYVTTAAGEHLAFCLMLNRFQGGEPDRAKTADLDAIAVMLAGFTGKTE